MIEVVLRLTMCEPVFNDLKDKKQLKVLNDLVIHKIFKKISPCSSVFLPPVELLVLQRPLWNSRDTSKNQVV